MATGREIAKELLKRKDVLAEVFTKVLVDSGVLKKKEVVVEVTKEVIKELPSEKEQELDAKITALEEEKAKLEKDIEGYKTSLDGKEQLVSSLETKIKELTAENVVDPSNELDESEGQDGETPPADAQTPGKKDKPNK